MVADNIIYGGRLPRPVTLSQLIPIRSHRQRFVGKIVMLEDGMLMDLCRYRNMCRFNSGVSRSFEFHFVPPSCLTSWDSSSTVTRYSKTSNGTGE